MKRYFGVALMALLLAAFLAIGGVAAENALDLGSMLADYGKGEKRTEAVAGEGNFDLIFRFTPSYQYEGASRMDAESGTAWFSLIIADKQGKALFKQTFGHASTVTNLPVDEQLALNVARYKQKIVLTLTRADGAELAKLTEKLKIEDETLYVCLETASMCALNGITCTVNGEASATSTWSFDQKYIGVIGVIGLVCLILLNKLCRSLEREFLLSKHPIGGRYVQIYHVYNGALWMLAVLLLVALLIPALGEIATDAVAGAFEIKPFALPNTGSILWILLLVAVVLCAGGIWLSVIRRSRYGAVGTTVMMFLFGAIHFITVFLIVAVAFRLLVVGGVLLVLFCVLTLPASQSAEQASEGGWGTFLIGEDGESFRVVSQSGGTGMIRNRQGNDISVYDWSETYVKDDAGHLYRKSGN